MADQQHLAKLSEGVAAWNQWRKNSHLQPYLQGANLYKAQLQGADLSGTQLQGADLREAFFDNATSLKEVILGDEKYGGALLADVRWGGVNLAVVDWSPLKMLGDEYEARRRPAVLIRMNDIGVSPNVKVLRLENYRTAVRANRQLAVVLRDQGLNEEADHFAYRAQLLQRIVWRLQQKWLKYIFSWFLDLLAGYGYRPLRSIIAYLLIILGFAVSYYALGHLHWYEALVVSLTAFHGRGFFSQLYQPGDPQSILAAIEAVLGLLIEISFIATFTQRFFGR